MALTRGEALYRAQAEYMLQRAEATTLPDIKMAYLNLAGQWLALAGLHELPTLASLPDIAAMAFDPDESDRASA
jgi:hypothetical protein